MRWYSSGIVSTYAKALFSATCVDSILISYFYEKRLCNTLQRTPELLGKKYNLLIDSGAFSAWSTGKEVNLVQYANFLETFNRRYRKEFKELHFVCLDKIPGRKGVQLTREENLEAPAVGWKNYLYLTEERKLPNIIPVYHQGEDIKWLKKMIDKTDFVGVSPSNDVSTKGRISWLDEVYRFVPKDVKTHGFAVTSPRLMRRYPWFSVDSATALLLGANDSIQVFINEKLLIFRCSEQHDTIPIQPDERKNVQEHLLKMSPRFTFEDVAKDVLLRTEINLRTFKQLEDWVSNRTCKEVYKQQLRLFDEIG